MKNVIFIAPPAAGKGTMSEFLVNNYNYNHISTGDLIREKIKLQDEEGKELERIIKSGQLVDDDRIFKLLEEKLSTMSKENHFILDGVPRTLQQAKKLDIILRDLGFSDYIVIYIHIDEEILMHRMTGRRICSHCQRTYNIYFEKFKPSKENTCNFCGHELIGRADDNEESFKVRYEIFNRHNEPLIAYYKEQNRFYEIDNSKEDPKETLNELQRIVGAIVD